MEQFVKLVAEMRTKQKGYFKLRGMKKHSEAKELLPLCKQLEKEVDIQLEELS